MTGATCPSSAAARRGVLTAAMLALLLPATALAAAGDVVDDGPPPRPEGITEGDIRGSIHRFDLEGAVRAFDTEGSVIALGEGVVEEEGETILSLSTDLLFSPNSWELPASAPARIAELVEEVPEAAEVRVTGHTDSRPTLEDFDNQELSERRAEAVAQALADERPDLELEVSGAGESAPAVREDDSDPETFAANRRVEIVYGGG